MMRRLRDPDVENDSKRLLDDWTVGQALRDIEAGRLDTDCVHDVMSRFAGSLDDYHRVQAALETATRIQRACGVTA